MAYNQNQHKNFPSVQAQDSDSTHAATPNPSSLDTANNQVSVPSDCKSDVSGPSFDQSLFNNGLIKLSPGDIAHDVIKQRFLSNLGSLAAHTTDLTIYKNGFVGVTWQARQQFFQIFNKAMEKKCGGDANVRCAWCFATRDEICKIVEHGFGLLGLPENSGLYGCGVYLSPDASLIESLNIATADKNGLRYLMLCRVILGKAELVQPGSSQYHPSSDDFDSGVDDLSSPKKVYFVEYAYEYSYLARVHSDFQSSFFLRRFKMPTSPWISFPALISALSKLLPPTSINLISMYYRDYKDKKILRRELVQLVRQIAGDRLLTDVIISSRTK